MELRARGWRFWAVAGLLLCAAAWCVFAWGVMPGLIRSAYAGEDVPVLSAALQNRAEWPVEHYLSRWNKAALLVLLGSLGGGALLLITTSQWFARRIVGLARPGTLGALRMFACLLAAWLVMSTNLEFVAAKPLSSRTSMGVMDLLYKLPLGLNQVVRSETALHALQAVTVAMLVAAAIGYRARWTLIAATALYLIVGGITRSYSKFNHAGVVPLYVLGVLCFTPCGDGWSLDRLIRQWRGKPVPPADEPQPQYAWGRYAVWCAVALSYVCAGLSKLGNGGLLWWDSTNMRRLLYEEAFDFGGGDHDLALQMAWVPPAVFAVIGLGTLALELGMGLTLVSKWARRLLPPMVALMHLGIQVVQRIPFFDLMLIQVIFYDWGVLRRWIGRRVNAGKPRLRVHISSASSRQQAWARVLPGLDLLNRLEIVPDAGTGEEQGLRVEHDGRSRAGIGAARAIARVVPLGWLILPLLYVPVLPGWIGRLLHAPKKLVTTVDASHLAERRRPWLPPVHVIGAVGVVMMTVVFLGGWAVRLEKYPLTSWQMFSTYNNKGVISYYKLYRTDESGRSGYAEPSQISAVGSRGYLGLLFWRAFRDEKGEAKAREQLLHAARRWNATAPPGRRIKELRLVRREWDFLNGGHDDDYGVEREALTVQIDPSTVPAAGPTRAARL